MASQAAEAPLLGHLTSSARDADTLLSAFLAYVAAEGLTLYPAQEEAILELATGANVILSTPTGSGKSLVALALHFFSLARGERSIYTCPIKALASEKFFQLSRVLGADNVGLVTGDGAVNRDAPVLCCTAEVLANMALRDGERAACRPRRHRRVPLLRRSRSRDGVAGAAPRAQERALPPHVGDVRRHRAVRADPHEAQRKADGGRALDAPPRPARLLVPRDPAPRDGPRPPPALSRPRVPRQLHAARLRGGGAEHDERGHRLEGREEGDRRGAPRRALRHPLREGAAEVPPPRHRAAPRGSAPEVPACRGEAGAEGAPQGDLGHRHPRRRREHPDPDRALHPAVQVRRGEDHHPPCTGLPPDQRSRGAEGLRRAGERRGPGPRARDREPSPGGEGGAGPGQEAAHRAEEAARQRLRALGQGDVRQARRPRRPSRSCRASR